jgi:hypothetical protein
MPGGLFIARFFLIGGVLLAATGLVLWIGLRIPSTFPPYLATALLAVTYGLVCRRANRPGTFPKS